MTNEELVKSVICSNCIWIRVCRNENYNSPCDKYVKMLEVAKAKDKEYKVLIDFIVEFLNNSGYDCETFCECMPEWCEKNCGSHNPNFNADCVLNWIKKQNEIKK